VLIENKIFSQANKNGKNTPNAGIVGTIRTPRRPISSSPHFLVA
jgi:hypothetical protein